MGKYSIVISSCDKFSDLWDEHIMLLKKHWKGELPNIYLITDKNTNREYDDVNILVYDGDMPNRLKSALLSISAKYVLVTLDDYFIIEDVDFKRLDELSDYADLNDVSYLSLYDRFRAKGYKYKRGNDIVDINLEEKYAVNLYPAIWKKDFLISCVDEDNSPWQFEPLLTNKCKENKSICKFDQSGPFVILDVVRKGKVLHKANTYFKKNGINIGDRPVSRRSTEFKLALMDFVKVHTPKWFSKICKKIAKKMGMKFYSED